MPTWITALFKPVADIVAKRQARKLAKETAKAKLVQAKQDDTFQLQLNQDEWEALAQKGLSDSWKDEYVTVSIVSILNLIVIGGILAAFNYPQVLNGLGAALSALEYSGVNIGFLMEAVILSAVGLSIWKKI